MAKKTKAEPETKETESGFNLGKFFNETKEELAK
ncbi:MAG: preprotein translocase subunit SecE, partial [Moorea sp. SIO3I6]|nr:preprotein translocase subunit SecE [Moorena sp. SIO3I6]